eukprot:547346_1
MNIDSEHLRVVKLLTWALRTTGEGLKTEGIFRIPATNEERIYVMQQIKSGETDLQMSSALVAASMLKQYIRDFEVPLIPNELYENCIEMTDFSKDSVDLLLMCLPGKHEPIMNELLHVVAESIDRKNSKSSRMSSHSFATVLAPTILRNEFDSSIVILTRMNMEIRFMHKLIEAYKKYWYDQNEPRLAGPSARHPQSESQSEPPVSPRVAVSFSEPSVSRRVSVSYSQPSVSRRVSVSQPDVSVSMSEVFVSPRSSGVLSKATIPESPSASLPEPQVSPRVATPLSESPRVRGSLPKSPVSQGMVGSPPKPSWSHIGSPPKPSWSQIVSKSDTVPQQPVGVMSQPVGVVSQPVSMVSQSVDVVFQPVDVVSQPVDVVFQPLGVVSQPVGVVSQSVDAVSQPALLPGVDSLPGVNLPRFNSLVWPRLSDQRPGKSPISIRKSPRRIKNSNRKSPRRIKHSPR